jgi:hypothetical protein
MKRLYERAAQLLRPDTMREIGQGVDPRVVHALRKAADELRGMAEYADTDNGTVAIADFKKVCADVLRIVKRHVWREVLGKEP